MSVGKLRIFVHLKQRRPVIVQKPIYVKRCTFYFDIISGEKEYAEDIGVFERIVYLLF